MDDRQKETIKQRLQILSRDDVYNSFLDIEDKNDINYKQLAVSMTLAYGVAILSFISLLIIYPQRDLLIISGLSVITIPLVYAITGFFFGERDGKLAKHILIILLMIAAPIIYIRSGGFFGIGSAWMIFCFAFTALNLNGKNRLLLLGIETLIFFAIIHFLMKYPELVPDIPQKTNALLSIVAVAIISLYIASVIIIQSRTVRIESIRYQNKQAELAEINEKLNIALEGQKLFTASINHELRAPLNGVMGCLQLLSMADNLTTEQREILAASKHSADGLVHMINDLLDYAKIEAGELEIINDDFDLKEIITGSSIIFDNLVREKGIKFITNVSDDMPCGLYGDGNRIQQVVSNVLSNAVKYTYEGSVTFNVDVKDNQLIIVVQDTGEGISEEAMEQLFTPFKRINEKAHKKIQGTGLGMYVTHMLLDKMDGTIEVESEVGVGSTFTICIPVEINDKNLVFSSVRDTSKRQGEVDFSDKKMLCVDDSRVNLTLFNNVIGHITGAKITTTDSGQKALDLLEKEEFDIIFLDHQMPEMDGLETYEAIRKNNKDVPVVIFTANVGPENAKKYMQLGFDAFLGKPMKADEVIGCLHRIFRR